MLTHMHLTSSMWSEQLFGASSHSFISYTDETDVIKLLPAEFACIYFMILNLYLLFTIYPF